LTRLPRHLLLLAALLLALPGAAFGNPERVIKDCAEDGDLDRKYSNAELRGARDNLPADLDEYSDCREVIGGAIKSGSDKGGGRGGGGPDAAAASSPEEQAARAQDQAELEAIASSGKKDPPTVDVG
jgi:hypothetical protein